MTKLTDRQEAFCREYIIDFNATQAAIRSGYSEDTADVQGSRLLGNVKVQKRLMELIEDRNNRVQVTADDVLSNLYQMATLDIADVLEDDGSVKPISQWPDVWRKAVGGVDVVEQIANGDTPIATFTKKIKGIDKLRVWELIGKHTDVNAWKEKVEHVGDADSPIHFQSKHVIEFKDYKDGD